jgi:hypothetical protein
MHPYRANTQLSTCQSSPTYRTLLLSPLYDPYYYYFNFNYLFMC